MTVREQIESAGVQVNASTVEELVRRIVAVADPERIVLFGSAARGTMRPGSDLDVLVIKPGQFDYHKLISSIYVALADFEQSVDVVLVTPEQVQRYKDSFCLVLYPALREGKVVYERAALSSETIEAADAHR
ncbi:MAG: nucleotidyltransferase domain-containing protein [Bryobacteraceae bacterium]